MRTLAGIVVAALALVSVTGACAQIVYYPDARYLAPPVVVAPVPAPPIVVVPSPYGMAYIPGPYPGSVVVNPYTGRWCTFEPSGWHWCWRP
jgi:hypothetical protein